MKKQSFSLVDFLKSIAEAVFLPNESQGTPYEISFSKHYDALYRFTSEFGSRFNREIGVERIIQQKRTKTIEVMLSDTFTPDEVEFINAYCVNNRIDNSYNINNMILYINKNTHGVLEERKW